MNDTWQIGDKHPDAPWTKGGVPLRCPVCGGLSVQRLGASAIEVDASVDLAWGYCEAHALKLNDSRWDRLRRRWYQRRVGVPAHVSGWKQGKYHVRPFERSKET
jgi:hypothetical protein